MLTVMAGTAINGAPAARPLDGDETTAVFEPLAFHDHVALAVSGGADSMALMTLCRHWLQGRAGAGPAVTVLTVDHRLRPESAGEAQWVAEAAARAGFAHHVLTWPGDKPRTGIQEAARKARYGLMVSHALNAGIPCLATAHTIDDQAETLAMRLARGSGLDGLAAMAETMIWGGVEIARPLLRVSRARLEASLRAEGVVWLDDPSNRNLRFERVRVRRALAAAAALGVSADRLALSARRLGRARKALDAMTGAFVARTLAIHDAGYGEIAFATLTAAPEEIALRTLARCAMAFGGHPAPPRLAKLEAFYGRLTAGLPTRATLGGCLFAAASGRLRICREAGRMGGDDLELAAGDTALWDGRFAVSAPPDAPRAVRVRALGVEGLTQCGSRGAADVPRSAAATGPSFWLGDRLLAAPVVGYAAAGEGAWPRGCRAAFANRALLTAGAA